jgi:hypothetical protein
MAADCDPTEDHEKYAGAVIPDPWDDPEQDDWPMNPEGGDEDGVDSDTAPASVQGPA